MKRKIIKKIATVFLWVIAVFVALDLLIVGLLFVPPIQNAVVHKVTSVLSENWGSGIEIGKIYVTPTLKITATDVVIRDNHQNPMITADKLKARLRRISFSPFLLSFYSLEAIGADVVLIKYTGEESVNIGLWARKLKKNEEKGQFKLKSNRIALTDSRFSFTNEATKVYNGTQPDMDYAFFEIKSIQLRGTDFLVNRDDISMQITKLSMNQYTGFELQDAGADFRINSRLLQFRKGRLLTSNSIIFLDLAFHYDNWSSYSSFVDSVKIVANVRPSILNMEDVTCFAPAIKGMDQRIVFKGLLNGVVSDFSLKDFYLRYGSHTYLSGDMAIRRVVDFKNAFFDVNIKEGAVHPDDIALFHLPKSRTIPLPDQVYLLGNTHFNLSFKGGLKDFSARLDLQSGLGNAVVDFNVKNRNRYYHYSAEAKLLNFHLGQLVGDSKLLGQVGTQFRLDGDLSESALKQNFLDGLRANVKGTVFRFDLLGYPVRNITVGGSLKSKIFQGDVTSLDENLNFVFSGAVDLAREITNIKAYASVHRFAPGNMMVHMPRLDSASTKGLDKMLLYVQKDPSIELSFDSLELNLNGTQIENLNGYLGIDGITLEKSGDTIKGERIRLTAINTEGIHKFILASNFLNATLTTNYPLSSIQDSIIAIGYSYFPNLLPPRNEIPDLRHRTEPGEEYYLKFSLETFQTRRLLDMLIPGLRIAPLSTCDLYLSTLKKRDSLLIKTRSVHYRDVLQVANLTIDGKGDEAKIFHVAMTSDSLTLPFENGGFVFKAIHADIQIEDDHISYDLQWMNPDAISRTESQLAGYVNAGNKNSIEIKFTRAALNITDTRWTVNQDHEIYIRNRGIDFQEFVLQSGTSSIGVNGKFSFDKEDNLIVDIKNLNLDLLNTFTERMKLNFGGDLSASVRLRAREKQRLVTGKILATNFMFNNEKMGNLFVSAAMSESFSVGFGGGLFQREEELNSASIDQYTYRDYNNEPSKIANLTGTFDGKKSRFEVKASIDTLNVGFVAPFLQSFSHLFSGKARGDLAFIATKDSTYFEGKITALDLYMGIAPLNTVYRMQNQVITFNEKGFEFNRILFTDIKGNTGRLNGHVYHNKFKDFRIDLAIETQQLTILNVSKAPDVYFYGDGVVSGNVTIQGDSEALHFRGNNLRTLPGSRIFFPITFSERLSETDGIRFKANPDRIQSMINQQEGQNAGMDLYFDFVFDVTKDAEVHLELDPSIGGTLTARTEGRLQLNVRPDAELNLLGKLNIVSGKFAMSFRDIFLNAKLDLQPGGTITFNGPIDRSVLDARALYKVTASLQDVLPDVSTRRVPINAYINLHGVLMNPGISFGFELPNNNEEDNARLNSAIDTANTNNGARQFFSLLLFSKFASLTETEQTVTTDLGNTSFEMLSNMLSNIISQQFKYGELGVNYRGAVGNNLAEYSVNASIPFLNDRIVVNTNLGYADAGRNNENANSYFIGDVSLEFVLNEEGSWRLKAFYSNNDNSSLMLDQQNQTQVGGVAIIYKKDFNDIKDLKESFKRKNKKKKEKVVEEE